MEVWKDIKGYEGIYKISTLGNIKSFYYKKNINKNNFKLLKKSLNFYGYERVNLSKNGIIKGYSVHNLMAINFLNHIPNRHNVVIDHINNIKTDNRLENLQLITQRENLSKDKKSKYVGVSWKKSANKWRAQIFFNNKLEHLGYFKTDIEANLAYQNRLKCVNTTT